MKVIYCSIGDNDYMIGFDVSVRAYLEKHQDGNVDMSKFDDEKTNNVLYHSGQRRDVEYWSADIKPKKMFLKL